MREGGREGGNKGGNEGGKGGGREGGRKGVTLYLIGCRSNIGGCVSANSTAVIPTAQISH